MSEPVPRLPRAIVGALAGLVAAAVALGVAELVAGLRSAWRSPVLDVGDRVVDNVPPAVKDLAIEQFGTNDKLALLIGIGVGVAIYAAVVGVLTFLRSVWFAPAGIALFAVVGLLASQSRRGGAPLSAVTPTVVGALVGTGALVLSWWLLDPRRAATGDDGSTDRAADPDTGDRDTGDRDTGDRDTGDRDAGDRDTGDRDTVDHSDDQAWWIPTPVASRRQLLVRGGVVLGVLAAAGGAAGAVGRTIRTRFSAAESRAKVSLPAPIEPLRPIPAAVDVGVPGVAPFVTPNENFYRIDTALTVPQLRTEDYELRVTGMVDRELRLSFDDLLARNVVEEAVTLTCVSNTIGGDLVGNARWLGVRLDELLAEAGIDPAADQVVGRSVDGYTCGFPVEAATDGRNALVAFGMNGEPLPLEHGFPVRLIVPGLYGYVSATKWLVEIELTRFDEFEQYWVPRGYADRGPIKLMSRIDSVDGLGTLTRGADGTVAVGGVAWAQTRGISAVEVQIDDGPWEPAELGAAFNDDTWRQWAYRWTPSTTGRVSVRCRAIDNNGMIQIAERSEPLPDGASGHHQVVVFVE